MADEDITYGVSIEFNKTNANIEFTNNPNASHFAHGIALLILTLNNQVEGGMNNTLHGVIDAINNIQGEKD